MNIDEMEAGRELDALVAEKVMGYSPCDKWVKHYGGWGMAVSGQGPIHTNDGCDHDSKCYPIGYPSTYSTDIAAAWDVVEKLQFAGFGISLTDYLDQSLCFAFYPPDAIREIKADGGTAPLAICRAALKAMRPEGE